MGCGSSSTSKPAVPGPVIGAQHADNTTSPSALAQVLTPAVKHAAEAAAALCARQAAAACQSLASGLSVQEAGGQVVEEWEQKVQLLDSLLSGEDIPDTSNPEDDIDAALGVMEGVIKLLQPDLPGGDIEVQQLKLPSRSKAESALRRYGLVGRAVVGLTSHAISALPFGAPVAAVLEGLYGRADQAAKNSENCRRLLLLVKDCDSQMKKLAAASSKQAPLDARSRVRRLAVLLVRAGHAINRYSGRHFMIRFVMSGSDMAVFQTLEADIRGTMQALSLVAAVEMLGRGYADEAAGLRAAVCKAAGLQDGEGRAQEALLLLRQQQPDVLAQLLRSEGRFSDQVVAEALEELGERLAGVEAKLSQVEAKVLELLAEVTWLRVKAVAAQEQSQGPISLKPFLREWWDSEFEEEQLEAGNVIITVPCKDFMDRLSAWICNNMKEEGMKKLRVFDKMLMKLVSSLGLSSSGLASEGCGSVFLDHVFARELDENADGLVTQDELLSVQIKAEAYARFKSCVEANWTMHDWLELLNSIFLGFDRDSLVPIASGRLMGSLEQRLQVKGIIQAYKIPSLVSQYVEGTRQWLYDEVNKWLDAATAVRGGAGEERSSRMFLLLAGPGMGKSVFSAVMHTHLMARPEAKRHVKMVKHFFFEKVGEPRAQGRAMLASLAYQVAEKLPGFGDLLLPVAEEHGTGAELPMTELFHRYLRAPLQQWDEANQAKPVLVLLVDALDEADDGNRGCLPVAHLLAKEFHTLPGFVRVILTARRQLGEQDTAQFFGGWAPLSIHPENSRNMEDMRKLLTLRLERSDVLVPAAELQAAVKVLVRKSKGEFIHAKYALFCMRLLKDRWTAAELDAEMPEGLGGAYTLSMLGLSSALRRDKPELMEMLTGKVLPVLVAAREPLSPEVIAWACGHPEWRGDGGGYAAHGSIRAQVRELLEALVHLFPMRPAPGGGLVVQAYHKSVLDWFEGAEGMDAGEFHVRPARGHGLLGSAGEAYCRTQLQMQAGAAVMAEPCNAYALMHTLAHLCLTDQPLPAAPLDGLLLNFGFWQHAYAAGAGPGVLRDLLGHSIASPVAKDVTRWLRACSALLAKHPQAALQLAVDAPSNSLVAMAAQALQLKPPARLLTKQADWPPLVATLLGHADSVRCVSISLDGLTVVSASDDQVLRVWDAQSGEATAVLQGHAGEVFSVAACPDGKSIASGSQDGTIRLWDLASGQEQRKLEGHTADVNSVAFSPDCKSVVSGSDDGTVRLWDVTTGQERVKLEGHTEAVSSVAISPDGRHIVSASWDRTLCIWDASAALLEMRLEGHTGRVRCTAICPHGTTIVSGSHDGTVRVWDMLSGQEKNKLEGHAAPVNCVAISPDGLTLVSGSGFLGFDDNGIRIWDLSSGEEVRRLEGHTDRVNTVIFSPDGKSIISGANDQTVRIWDATAGQEGSDLQDSVDYITSVAISSDGKTIVSGSADRTIRAKSLSSGQESCKLSGHADWVRSVALCPDGKTVVSASDDKTVRVWDLASGQEKAILEGHSDMVWSVAVSPDGSTLVSGSEDTTICVWNLLSGQEKSRLVGHTLRVSSVALSADGTTVASGSSDLTVRLWDLASGQEQRKLEGHTADVNSVAFSPDCKSVVSGSDDGTVRLWDVTSGQERTKLEGHTGAVFSVAISPDGRHIASGSWDKTVRVWDATSGRQTNELLGHTESVSSVVFSPDCSSIVSGSDDGTVRVWNFASEREVNVFIRQEASQRLQEEAQCDEDDAPLVVASPDGNGQVLELFAPSSMGGSPPQLVSTVYVTPPLQVNTSKTMASSKAKKLAAFTKGNRFLCFELA